MKEEAQHNPNAGENEMNYDSSKSRSSTTGIGDSAGVGDGLSMIESADVKNAESVTQNQRPEADRKGAGSPFTIGL